MTNCIVVTVRQPVPSVGVAERVRRLPLREVGAVAAEEEGVAEARHGRLAREEDAGRRGPGTLSRERFAEGRQGRRRVARGLGPLPRPQRAAPLPDADRRAEDVVEVRRALGGDDRVASPDVRLVHERLVAAPHEREAVPEEAFRRPVPVVRAGELAVRVPVVAVRPRAVRDGEDLVEPAVAVGLRPPPDGRRHADRLRLHAGRTARGQVPGRAARARWWTRRAGSRRRT